MNKIIDDTQQKFITQSNENFAVLKKISDTHDAQINEKKTYLLVATAALKIVGSFELYKLGKKKITALQQSKIEFEFKRLQKKKISKLETDSRKKNKYRTMVARLQSRSLDPNNSKDLTMLFDDFYQIMGCAVAYGKWKVGDTIEGPHKEFSAYQVHKVIKNKHGLKITVLVPCSSDDKYAHPIFCVRGTTSNPHNFIDDLNTIIGMYSIQCSKEGNSLKQILNTLNEVTQTYGSAVFTGHSLGGAITQILTTEYCDQVNGANKPLIKSAYYFNAPGVGDDIVSSYVAKTKKLGRAPNVVDFHHTGDAAYLSGGPHIPASRSIALGEFSLLAMLKPTQCFKSSHSWTNLISEFKTQHVITKISRSRKLLNKIAERVRRLVSGIFIMFIFRSIREKEKLKELSRKIIELNSESISEEIKKMYENQIESQKILSEEIQQNTRWHVPTLNWRYFSPLKRLAN